MLGYGPELRGADVLCGAPADAREEVREVVETIESGETKRLTAPILTASGERRIAESVFKRRHGRIYHYLVRVFEERRAAKRRRNKAGTA